MTKITYKSKGGKGWVEFLKTKNYETKKIIKNFIYLIFEKIKIAIMPYF